MKALGVTYHFLSKPLIEMAKCHLDPKKPSICDSAGVGWFGVVGLGNRRFTGFPLEILIFGDKCRVITIVEENNL